MLNDLCMKMKALIKTSRNSRMNADERQRTVIWACALPILRCFGLTKVSVRTTKKQKSPAGWLLVLTSGSGINENHKKEAESPLSHGGVEHIYSETITKIESGELDFTGRNDLQVQSRRHIWDAKWDSLGWFQQSRLEKWVCASQSSCQNACTASLNRPKRIFQINPARFTYGNNTLAL
jgi:hypothetical protein